MRAYLKTNLITLLILTGCARQDPFVAEDSVAIPFDANDSFAMNILTQGTGRIPFEIEDVQVEGDNPMVDGDQFLKASSLAGVLMDLSANWWMAPMMFSNNPYSGKAYAIAYVPADKFTMSDIEGIESYVLNEYIFPAVKKYIATEPKNLQYPSRFTKFRDEPRDYVQGDMCKIRYAMFEGSTRFDNKYCGFVHRTRPVRYASLNTGLPFTPTDGVQKFIVVNFQVDATVAHFARYTTTDKVFYYIPNRADQRATNVEKERYPDFHKPVPYVMFKRKPTDTELSYSFFIKKKATKS